MDRLLALYRKIPMVLLVKDGFLYGFQRLMINSAQAVNASEV